MKANPNKMTLKEYKRKKIKSMNVVFKMMYYLWVTNLKVVDKGVWKNNNDFNYSIRALNPYNPLSYIVFVLTTPLVILTEGLRNVGVEEIKTWFKYQ